MKLDQSEIDNIIDEEIISLTDNVHIQDIVLDHNSRIHYLDS